MVADCICCIDSAGARRCDRPQGRPACRDRLVAPQTRRRQPRRLHARSGRNDTLAFNRCSVLVMSDDLPGLRASHQDRDRVVDVLRVAAGDGRLSAEELDARLENAHSARTLGELAELTADLPSGPAAKEVLVIEQHGSKYVLDGRWQVPTRIELRTQLCRVTLDFTHAVITSRALRIDTDMVHGRLFIVCPPGALIDTSGLSLTYSELKLRSKDAAADPSLHIELAGRLLHAKIIERRPRR